MAVNCRAAPTVRLSADTGIMVMADSTGTGTITVKFTAGLVLLLNDADIADEPLAIPVAKPEAETLATVELELLHDTWEVISAFLPSE